MAINSLLLFTNDTFLNEKMGANLIYKSYSSGVLNWNHFKKTDSIEGGFGACIAADIFYRINRTYNYTSATAIAKVDLDSNKVVTYSENLLKHERYHFKIAEMVTRRLNRRLDECHFSSYENTKTLIWHYLDTLYFTQSSYDRETEHNLNSTRQEEWEKFIDAELIKTP